MDNFGLELVLVGIAFVAALWAADVTAMSPMVVISDAKTVSRRLTTPAGGRGLR